MDEFGTRDGYLFAGARVPHVLHRSYLKAFTKTAKNAGIPAGFTWLACLARCRRYRLVCPARAL